VSCTTLSHTLSLIGVKAAVANHVAESRPDEVRDALQIIATTSRAALAEMRHMLGVLRSDGTTADLRPLPRLRGLPEIAERAALAGDVTDEGPGQRALPGPPGHGLIGMRERCHLHGGTFTAGPRPQGGFAVSVRLPYPPAEESS
jgi:signal transduction histidine kinase